jgi:CubicO group peptidase (beta-lactamase class C family)
MTRSTTCTALAALLLASSLPALADVFPGNTWESAPPETLGLDAAKLAEFQALVAGSGMIVRNGKVGWTWGDISAPNNWASASKPVLSTMLFLASQKGLCTPQSTMGEYFTDGTAKDRAITFHHLANMTSGYGRGEPAGAAYLYNDYAINLYGYALYHGVFGGEPSEVFPVELGFLQFQDSPLMSDGQYGRCVAVSIRDFARIGHLWLNRGTWDGVEHIASTYFDLVTNQVPLGMPTSTVDGEASWDLGTFGGAENQGGGGQGRYGYNFWVNTNGLWPDAPANVFAAIGHGGRENCFVFPSLGLVATGVGTWGNPSIEAVRLLVEAAGPITSVEQRSWGLIKADYAP